MNLQKLIRKWVGLLIGGGDMNGIVYLMPQLLTQAIFAIILIVNAVVFTKYILPKYKKAFER
ncbi:MAG: hypothetical protein RR495_04120 [Anaerovoracaceae bacterium]